jgi:hypothetical protein
MPVQTQSFSEGSIRYQKHRTVLTPLEPLPAEKCPGTLERHICLYSEILRWGLH